MALPRNKKLAPDQLEATRHFYFELFKSWGNEQILEWIAQGYTLSRIAEEENVPLTILQEYVHKKINRGSYTAARQAAAGRYIDRTDQYLTSAVNSLETMSSDRITASAQLFRGVSQYAMSMAERMNSPEYGPPIPLAPPIAPVSIVMQFDKVQPKPIVDGRAERIVRPTQQIEAAEEIENF